MSVIINNAGIKTNADVSVKNLNDKRRWDEGFIQNPSKCECECDKSCDVGQYLDYGSCKCRRKLIEMLVEEYSENIDGNELIYNATVTLIWVEGVILPPCWFSLNNSETVKAVNLAFCSI